MLRYAEVVSGSVLRAAAAGCTCGMRCAKNCATSPSRAAETKGTPPARSTCSRVECGEAEADER